MTSKISYAVAPSIGPTSSVKRHCRKVVATPSIMITLSYHSFYSVFRLLFVVLFLFFCLRVCLLISFLIQI